MAETTHALTHEEALERIKDLERALAHIRGLIEELEPEAVA